MEGVAKRHSLCRLFFSFLSAGEMFCPSPELFRLFPLSPRAAALSSSRHRRASLLPRHRKKRAPAVHGRARLHACPRNATRHTPSRLAPRAFPHSVGQANNSASGPSGTGAANSHSFPSSRRTGTPRAASAARNGSGPSSGKVSRSVR